ncbi:MAG TPA: hypothetical protein VGM90_15320 [Kofleriaceae bacterium]|jgi:hypothetical protein
MRLASFVLIALAGCSITDFDIDQPVPEQHVQGSPLPGPLATLFPLQLDLDISQKIKAQETGPIDSVTLSSLELNITATDRPSGDTDDWSFVDSVQVFVSSTKSGTTLPRVEIAHGDHPGAVQKFKFVVDGDVNLKDYIDEGSMVESSSSGTAPPDDTSFDGKSTFTVHPL